MRHDTSGVRTLLMVSAIGAALWVLALPSSALMSYVMVDKWGSQGSGDGQFEFTWDCPHIAVDSTGNVYVTDPGNYRVQKFSSGGSFIRKWGSKGTGNSQFDYPTGIAVSPTGRVYVSEFGYFGAGRVQEFTTDGAYVRQWNGGPVDPDDKFYRGQDVDLDSSGNVYVVDSGKQRIQKFTADGVFIAKWGSWGGGPGQFLWASGVAVDGLGRVYVSEDGNHRVQRFSGNGVYQLTWGSEGGAPGQFNTPLDVAAGPSGNIFVSDSVNDRVQKFDCRGHFLLEFGDTGSGDGRFFGPSGLAVNAAGEVYVADDGNHRIEKFRAYNFQPDMRARVSTSDPWKFDGKYGPVSTQTLTAGVVEGATRVFHLSVQNDSDIPDTFRIYGDASSARWTIHYFSSPSGSIDVTSEVTGGGGWEVGPLSVGASRSFRMEITAASPLAGGSQRSCVVRAVSQTDGLSNDAVKLVAQVRKRWRPDARIRVWGDPAWSGDNIYNKNASGQVRKLTIAKGKTALYRLSMQNDGNMKEALKVTGPGSDTKWKVRYFNAFSGGTDVTSQVIGGGWTTAVLKPGKLQNMRVEITPKSAAVSGDKKAVLVTLASTSKPAIKDTAKAIAVVKNLSPASVCQVTSLTAIPTRAGAQVTFALSAPARVEARVLNIAGRPVRTLCTGRLCEAGTNTLLWNAISDQGLRVPNGMYLIEVRASATDGSEAQALGQVRVVR